MTDVSLPYFFYALGILLREGTEAMLVVVRLRLQQLLGGGVQSTPAKYPRTP